MQEQVTKHLEFAQTVIGRMASNSFLLKGWSVTLSAALFALAAKDANRMFAIIALFPALSFWGLDAYYLRQERLFCKLYDDLRLAAHQGTPAVEPFSMATEKYKAQVASWFCTLWSPTVVGLHGMVVLVLAIVILLLSFIR
jgi:hypothetical protein